MNRITNLAAGRPRLFGLLTLIVAIVVAGCKNNGGGSGY